MSELNLYNFFKSNPKYAGIAAGTLLFSAEFTAPILFATLLLSKHTSKKTNSKKSVLEIEKFIKESINSSIGEISQKKEEIQAIQNEISEKEKEVVELKRLLAEIQSYKKGNGSNE